MRAHAVPLLALVSLPLAGCGDLFALRIEEPALCITLEEQEFEASEAELPTQSKELEFDLSPALPEQARDDDMELEVELTSFEVRPRRGENLDFLDAAELRLVDRENEVPVASWRAGEAPPAVFTVAQGVDLGTAVKKAQMRFVLDVTGKLPTTVWSADAEACFHVVGTVRYFD